MITDALEVLNSLPAESRKRIVELIESAPMWKVCNLQFDYTDWFPLSDSCYNDCIRPPAQKRVRGYAYLLRENCSIQKHRETAVYENRTYSGVRASPCQCLLVGQATQLCTGLFIRLKLLEINFIITRATKAHKKVAYNHANQRKKKRKCG